MCSTHTSHTRHIHLPLPSHFHHFYFDTHFDKLQQNQAFPHFSHHQKSPLTNQKSPQTLKYQVFYRSQPKDLTYITKIAHHNISNPISQFPIILIKSIPFHYTKFTKQNLLCRSHNPVSNSHQNFSTPLTPSHIASNNKQHTHDISYQQSLE